ncbi:methyltransferase domain-containing protein [Pseudomonas sp. NA13]
MPPVNGCPALSGNFAGRRTAHARRRVGPVLRRLSGALRTFGADAAVGTASPAQRAPGGAVARVEIVCEEQAWPLSEHAADVVVMQHGLDFCLSPHGLLREAASSVRPGGHLLIIGINPWSAWGLRHVFAHDALRQARCISASRVGDWLNLLGFALEKRRFGCYRPPLASPKWQARLAGWERKAGDWQLSGGGFYLLVARKIAVGLRPVRQARREPMGKLIPLPMAKVNRRHIGP